MKGLLVAILLVVSGCKTVPDRPHLSLVASIGFGNREQIRANLFWCRRVGDCPVNQQNALGLTPLHSAAILGRADITRLLLDAGADPDARDAGGSTPLHRAFAAGHVTVARILLDAGADIDAQDQFGVTPRKLASKVERGEIAEVPLSANDEGEFDLAYWRSVFVGAVVFGVAYGSLTAFTAAVHRRRHRGFHSPEYATAAFSVWAEDERERRTVTKGIAGSPEPDAQTRGTEKLEFDDPPELIR